MASCAPVIVGTGVAWGHGGLHWPSALCALLGAVLIQVGTNLANDYFDFVKGADTADRVGPTRATQAGLISPETMRRAFIIIFLAVALPGGYIMWRGGWPFLVIGVASIICGIMYTAGPYPLGYVGLGDVFVLVFFGPVAVCGTYYLQARTVSADVAVASMGPGLLSVALLAVNNLRDIDQDARAGKRTLAVRFGRGFARLEYSLCLAIACIGVPMYFLATTRSLVFLLPAVVTLPLCVSAVRAVHTRTDAEVLNRVLAKTGALLLVFSVLFSLGWVL